MGRRELNRSASSETETLNSADAQWDELAAKYFGPETAPVNVSFGALALPGNVRTNNKDHFLVVPAREQSAIDARCGS